MATCISSAIPRESSDGHCTPSLHRASKVESKLSPWQYTYRNQDPRILARPPYNNLVVIVIFEKLALYETDSSSPNGVKLKVGEPSTGGKLRFGIGTIIAPNRVLTCGSLLSTAEDEQTKEITDVSQDPQKLRPRQPPRFYKCCKVRNAQSCLAIPVNRFISLTAGQQKDFYGLRYQHGGIVAKRYQTTAIDGFSKFGAWAQKTPFPPRPDLAILHFEADADLIPDPFPEIVRERRWPRSEASPVIAFAYGLTKIPFENDRYCFVKAEMKCLEPNELTPSYQPSQLFYSRDESKNMPEALDAYPRFPLIEMQGTGFPDMRGSPIYISPDPLTAISNKWAGMNLVVVLLVLVVLTL